jgi:hypothetical protein
MSLPLHFNCRHSSFSLFFIALTLAIVRSLSIDRAHIISIFQGFCAFTHVDCASVLVQGHCKVIRAKLSTTNAIFFLFRGSFLALNLISRSTNARSPLIVIALICCFLSSSHESFCLPVALFCLSLLKGKACHPPHPKSLL